MAESDGISPLLFLHLRHSRHRVRPNKLNDSGGRSEVFNLLLILDSLSDDLYLYMGGEMMRFFNAMHWNTTPVMSPSGDKVYFNKLTGEPRKEQDFTEEELRGIKFMKSVIE